MAFTQTTFLGSSIVQFSSTIGWGGTSSTLNVTLVDDPKNGDSFDPPGIGGIVLFDYDGWIFNGILQSYRTVADTNGNPTYEIVVNDPREILDGAHLILDGYAGTTFDVPNIFNVFGFIEFVDGFGSASVNDAGMPWKNVRDGLIRLINDTTETFGGPIRLKGSNYRINLDALPILPDSYRVSSPNLTVMQFIQEICDAANHEFFFELNQELVEIEPSKGPLIPAVTELANIIKIITINRNATPTLNKIAEFIDGLDGFVAKEVGFEFVNETTSKFLVGGDLSDIIRTVVDDAEDKPPEDNTIWTFWGLDDNSNAIISVANHDIDDINIPGGIIEQFSTIVLPSKYLDVPNLSDTYTTDIRELQAASKDYTSWETFLSLNNNNQFIIDENGNQTVPFQEFEKDANGDIKKPNNEISQEFDITVISGGVKTIDTININYSHSNQKNVHYLKADLFGLSSSIDLQSFMNLVNGTATNHQVNNFANNTSKSNLKTKSRAKLPVGATVNEENYKQRLYDFVKGFADKYGKDFMIRMPNTNAAFESETGDIQLSTVPEQVGFLNESLFASGVGLLPANTDKLTDSDGRVNCYAVFQHINGRDATNDLDELTPLDFSRINNEDITLSEDKNTAYIKCQVSEQTVFQDRSLLLSPRAVISMPASVGEISTINNTNQVAYNALNSFMNGVSTPTGSTATNKFSGLSAADQAQVLKDTLTSAGSDGFNVGTQGHAIWPNFIMLPLRSKTETYGPWIAVGAQGRAEFERDETLVPWNFGGFDALNNAATARVSEALSTQQDSEGGNVEFAGSPVVQLGRALISGGPYLTSVNVSVSNQVTTKYIFNIWTPHPYKLRKIQAEAVTKLAKAQQQQRRSFRKLINDNTLLGEIGKVKGVNADTPARNKVSSSNSLIISQFAGDVEGGFYSNTALQPSYNFETQLGDDDSLGKKAAASLDSLFRPFSTDTSPIESEMPHFESGIGTITAATLNPFGDDHDIGVILRGSGLPDNLDLFSYEQTGDELDNTRGVALRGPLVVAGWAYDIYSNPLPNDGSDFLDNHRRRMDQWKTGPVDLRYDNVRKIYNGIGDGFGLRRGILTEELTNSNNAAVTFQEFNTSTEVWDTTANTDTTRSGLPIGTDTVAIGSIVWMVAISNDNFAIIAECASE